MGSNAKLRRDINSPDFSTCLLLIQLVWVAVDLKSYHILNRVGIKSHNRRKYLGTDCINRAALIAEPIVKMLIGFD